MYMVAHRVAWARQQALLEVARMAQFTGTNANEIITPKQVSPTVPVTGSPSKPSAAADLILAGRQ